MASAVALVVESVEECEVELAVELEAESARTELWAVAQEDLEVPEEALTTLGALVLI